MRFHLKIDLIAVVAFLVMILQVRISPLFFFVPAAVAILCDRASLRGILLCVGFFAAQMVLLSASLQPLDFLMMTLSYGFGFYLYFCMRKELRFSHLVYIPLVLPFVCVLGLFLLNGQDLSFQEWSTQQIQASSLTPIQEMGEWPSAATKDLYETLVLPFLKTTFLAWFSFVFALAFFVNAVLENLTRSRRLKTWEDFLRWRSHDAVLGALVLGLGLIALPYLAPGVFSSKVWLTLGLHIGMLALFPIFVQGAAVASFFIPRASLFLFLVIFALLLLEPLPVLLLAGFCDLWFDFRSKLKVDRIK